MFKVRTATAGAFPNSFSATIAMLVMQSFIWPLQDTVSVCMVVLVVLAGRHSLCRPCRFGVFANRAPVNLGGILLSLGVWERRRIYRCSDSVAEHFDGIL
jgi:hypothetical protein